MLSTLRSLRMCSTLLNPRISSKWNKTYKSRGSSQTHFPCFERYMGFRLLILPIELRAAKINKMCLSWNILQFFWDSLGRSASAGDRQSVTIYVNHVNMSYSMPCVDISSNRAWYYQVLYLYEQILCCERILFWDFECFKKIFRYLGPIRTWRPMDAWPKWWCL